MSDLFTLVDAQQARAATDARFNAIWSSPEGRARWRRTRIDLARGLIEEARLCRLLGWPRAAAWWLAQAGAARREAAE